MASEFLPLHQLINAVEASLVVAGETIADRRGAVNFALGECTVALSAELRSDGKTTVARLPEFAEGKAPVPPEYLSRISFTLRPSVGGLDR